jgi:hypothetical protein
MASGTGMSNIVDPNPSNIIGQSGSGSGSILASAHNGNIFPNSMGGVQSMFESKGGYRPHKPKRHTKKMGGKKCKRVRWGGRRHTTKRRR